VTDGCFMSRAVYSKHLSKLERSGESILEHS